MRDYRIDNSNFDAISNFVLNLEVNEIPNKELEMASLLLADTLAVCAAASIFPSGKLSRETAVKLYNSTDTEYQAPILFDGRITSMAGAAFAGASQTDNLDAHDGYYPTKGHIGCAVVPALFAYANKLPDLSGRDLLGAMVVGYEVATRAAIALHETVSDYHTSGAWNCVGVAAMGARLRNHTSEQLRHSMGIAEYHGPRSQMMREIEHPSMLHDGSGMGAHVGVSSCIMAEMGFTGAPAITAEGDLEYKYWQDLGKNWTVSKNYIKPYPICRWAHPAIDAVRRLKIDHNFDWHTIKAIKITTFLEASKLSIETPTTPSNAQYALGYPVAVMIVTGDVTATDILPSSFDREDVKTVLEKISVIENPDYSQRFPAERISDVEITLNNGDVLKSGLTHPRGGLENPMTQEEIYQKFLNLTISIIGKTKSEKLFEQCLRLTDDNVKAGDLADLIY